jgi:transposase
MVERIHPEGHWDDVEAGKQRLAGNTKRQANSSEVKELRTENNQLKELVAELALKNKVLKKSLLG